ncbi:MAG: type II toxin-antitoxin system Phd/YefM family antitoxin [Clostridia bacterium]
MTNTTVTNFRQNAFAYVEAAVKHNDVISVTTKHGNAVLLNEDEYNGMVETLHLMSVPGLAKSLLEAAAEPLAQGTPYVQGEEW